MPPLHLFGDLLVGPAEQGSLAHDAPLYRTSGPPVNVQLLSKDKKTLDQSASRI